MRRRSFLAAACASALDLRAQRWLGRIAFVQPEGLTVRSLPDGPFVRVATGSRTRSPRFSPSGRWIAYYDGDDLHVALPEGPPPALLPSGECRWMPGQDVLAVASGADLLFFAARNGWHVPSLIRKGTGIPVFDPAGAEFLFPAAVRRVSGPAGESLREGQIRHGFYTGALRPSQIVTAKNGSSLIPFAWTPDSRSLLYWEDPDFSASLMADGLDLCRVAVSGGDAQPLGVKTLVQRDLLSLAPRGNSLALTVGAGRETWEGKRIAVLDLDTLALRYLTDRSIAALAPSWSPDARRIAFSAAPASTESNVAQRRIWVADGRGVRALTADPRYRDEKPLWSARGTHVLFCRMEAPGRAALWLMDTHGTEAEQVSGPLQIPPDYYGYIDWSAAFDWFRAGFVPAADA